MNIFHAIVLGIAQGLSEFLPVSSSAHLILIPWLLRWPDPGLGFDVALHIGTLFAVLFYFWQDFWLIIKGFFHSLMPATRDLQNNIYQKLAWLLIIASVPGAIVGKLFESAADRAFRAPLLIGVALAFGGLILFIADQVGKKTKNFNHFSYGHALILGLSQAFSVIPGISRSGSTMTAGLFLGFNKQDAAKFSFLMSAPIILGAGLLEIRHFHEGATTPELLIGIIASTIFGILAIKYMLRFLANHSYKVFAWYRFALLVLILIVLLARK